jgi:hypothetical protein
LVAAQSMDKEREASDGSIVRVGLAELEGSRFLIEDHRSGTQLSKEDLIKLVNPSHATFPNDSSDVKEKPVRIEILEPDVKEILSTCALYNLDQVSYPLLRMFCFVKLQIYSSLNETL